MGLVRARDAIIRSALAAPYHEIVQAEDLLPRGVPYEDRLTGAASVIDVAIASERGPNTLQNDNAALPAVAIFPCDNSQILLRHFARR
jgi:hypothetical protein